MPVTDITTDPQQLTMTLTADFTTTERMQGMPVETINDMSLYEEDGVTLVTLLIEYPDKDTRDMIFGTGMADGMEQSYQRLEREVLGA